MAQALQSIEKIKYVQEVPPLTDTHCHLDLFQNAAAVVNDAFSHGVRTIITSGGSAKGNEATSKIVKILSVFGVVGIDPASSGAESEYIDSYVAMIKSNPRLVGIGEIGLDSHVEEKNPPEVQKSAFIRQIRIANELGVPVVIHSRGRMADVIKVTDEHKPEKAMFHFFEGDVEQARYLAGKGHMISIPPRYSSRMKRIINEIDLSSMVAETDAPVAGKTPSDIREVVEAISSIKKLEFGNVAEALSENAKVFFHI